MATIAYTPPAPRRRASRLALWTTQLVRFLWFIALCGLGFVYTAIISEGLRLVVPPLAVRMHKLPGLGELKYYEASADWDLALPFSVFLLIGCTISWEKILRLFLGIPLAGNEFGNTENYRRLVIGLGSLLLVSDMCLFYAAMGTMNWGSESGLSFGALLATAAYVGVLIFSAFISITLHQRAEYLREELNYAKP